jgi:Domain of unknown function (DUF4783)
MKKIKLIFSTLTLAIMLFVCNNVAKANELNDGIKTGLSSGNAESIKSYIGNTCTITIGSTANNLNALQSKLILQNFFNTNKPISFQLTQEGGSRTSNAKYAVGVLKTVNGNFDVYITLDLMNDNVIKEIRITQ